MLDRDFRRPKQGVLAVLLMNFLLDKKGREKRCTYPEGILNIFSKTLKIDVFPSLPYNTPPPFVRKPLIDYSILIVSDPIQMPALSFLSWKVIFAIFCVAYKKRRTFGSSLEKDTFIDLLSHCFAS